jgi:hypothetical protein
VLLAAHHTTWRRGRCCGKAQMPGVAELQPSDLLAHGLPGGPSAAASWVARLRALHANAHSLADPAAQGQQQQQATLTVWRAVSKDLLRPPPEHPFELHQLLYDAVYHTWDVAVLGPRPVWIPTAEVHRARPSASVQTSCGCWVPWPPQSAQQDTINLGHGPPGYTRCVSRMWMHCGVYLEHGTSHRRRAGAGENPATGSGADQPGSLHAKVTAHEMAGMHLSERERV